MRTPITDGAHGRPWVFRYKDIRSWWSNPHRNRPGGVESGATTAWVPESKPIRFTEIGCPAVDRGPNQPNVFYDPKSAESFLPYFSRGWRDDAVQRRFLEAVLGYWAEPANNPTSSVYSGRMITTAETAAWTWDARPYPAFPARSDVWTDADNWRLGHWLNGRLGSVSLGSLVRELCRRAGLPDDQIDASALADVVHGYLISALESPRASIAPLARQFGFDAVESEGVIRFQPRDRRPVATLGLDDLAVGERADGEVIELVRAQETELPQALKWQVLNAEEDYDAMTVEARRATGEALRVTSESFAIATIASDADRRCRRALLEEWVGRETASFRLPPSRLALDPGDVVQLDHDGRLTSLRLTSTADAGARLVEAVRTDAGAFGLAPGPEREPRAPKPVVYGPPSVAFLDLPQLRESVPAHQPLAAVYAVPWPGRVAVWRSPGEDGFELVTTLGRPARIGTLVADLYPGPTSRFDLGNVAIVDLAFGTLASVTDVALFGGANALAVEAAPGVWEVLQFGVAELIAPGRYRLSRLLRGQRGTEGAMGTPAPAGARVVVLDEALAPLPVAEAALGLEANWRVGPASKPVSDRSYRALSFTPEGVGLRPFSVGHVEQPWRTARAPGDLMIRWTRRSRALAADSWTAPEVPLAEESEAYEVEILDGADRAADAEHHHDQRHLHRRPADRRLGRAARARRHARRPHLPALRPRRARRPEVRHPAVLKAIHARHQHPPPAAVPAGGAGAEARHRQRGAAAARRARAARGPRPPPDRAAGLARRRRSLHRRVRRHRRLVRLGPERRLLGRRRLDAAGAAPGLAGLGRRRGDLPRLGRQRLDRRRPAGLLLRRGLRAGARRRPDPARGLRPRGDRRGCHAHALRCPTSRPSSPASPARRPSTATRPSPASSRRAVRWRRSAPRPAPPPTASEPARRLPAPPRR